MENQKLAQTKNSLLISSGNSYSEEVNETARKRCIYFILVEIVGIILYAILDIVYLNTNSIGILYLTINLLLLLFVGVVQCYSVHALVFFKDHILSKSANFSVMLFCFIIIPLVLQMIEEEKFGTKIMPQLIVLTIILVFCIMEQYLLRTFVLEYIKGKQRYNIRQAIYSKQSFEENFSRSVASKSGVSME